MRTSHSTTASAIATLAITALFLGGCAAVEGSNDGDAGSSGSQKNQDSSSTTSDAVQIPEGDITVEVFTASDLDQSVGPIIEDTLLAAQLGQPPSEASAVVSENFLCFGNTGSSCQ